MKLTLERMRKDDELTFSEEGIVSFLFTTMDFINKSLAMTIREGFKKNNPIVNLELELTIRANDRKVNIEKLLELSEYKNLMGFDIQKLARKIIEKEQAID